ncbi:MAG: hypothetical protein A2Y34_00100 [Spirochaetes bacterium GWC1_27_15]|nr:MAG: hypothetical protein A2Z98_07210 [Spirochaetes bacterium GWB1_27_13]OHD22065.1 MAG: hypothetical protein A2Y34_00100 [Spirochaetes bacterium GWC1_27_15]
MSKAKFNLKITFNFFLITLSFAIVPLIIVVYFSLINIFGFLENQNKIYYSSLLKQLTNNFDYQYSQYENNFKQITENQSFLKLINFNPKNEVEEFVLNNSLEEPNNELENKSFKKFVLSNIDGDFALIQLDKFSFFDNAPKIDYFSNSNLIINSKELLKDSLYLKLLSEKKMVFGTLSSNVLINFTDQKKAVFIYPYSSKEKNNFDKLLIVVLNEDFISKLIKFIEDLQNGYLIVLDNNDNPINSIFDKKNIVNTPEISRLIYKLNQQLKLKELKDYNYFDTTSYGNKKYLTLANYDFISKIKFVFFLPIQKIKFSGYKLVRIILLVALLILILSFIGILILTNKFAKPIETTATTIQEENIYFSNLAHETKTPLTLISNYLEKYTKTVPESDDLKIIKQNIDKLKNDMINFLDAGKLERGQIFYNNNEIIDLSDFLTKKTALYRETANKKNIQITDNIENNIFIKIDSLALDRIVNNIVDNAIKYTNNDGKVEIRLISVNNNAELIISDNGIGISEKQIKFLFKPFHQISHKKRSTQGVGLGLHIVSKIIQSVKGQIKVESIPQKGTTFKIDIPQYFTKNKDIVSKNLEYSNIIDSSNKNIDLQEAEIKKERSNILIVEDNIDLLVYLKTNFEKEYNVFIAKNGKEALEKLKTIDKPDLIISDVTMDEMTGIEFLEEISKSDRFKDIPFIFLSALDSIDEKIKGFSNGAVDYILKPFSIKELLAKVSSIIKYHSLKKILYEKDKYATLGMLLGGISHEIFNPLAGIYGPIELIEKNIQQSDIKDKSKLAKYFNDVYNNIKRIENIIKNIKILYYNKKVQKEAIDLQKIVDSLTEIFKSKIKEKITITTEIAEDFYVEGSNSFVTQILMNLISNAIEAIENDGQIKVVAKQENNKKYIIVSDTGSGIAENEINNIFNVFYTTKEVGKGVGLGLYIVKDLVLKMGWSISVKSQKGEGTSFIIEI